MSNATALLNLIAAETGSTDKSACINAAIAMLVKAGASIDAAFDAVLGEGAYKNFAAQVYNELRARQA